MRTLTGGDARDLIVAAAEHRFGQISPLNIVL
jgi:hypothetical protein